MSIYREAIMDHYKEPRNFGKLDEYNVECFDQNPLCGDKVKIYLKVEDGKIKDIKYEAEGCAISISAASMLSEEIKGKTVDNIKSLERDDILDMIGLKLTPMRIKCALLSLVAIKKGLNKNEA